jgi:cytochrome b561
MFHFHLTESLRLSQMHISSELPPTKTLIGAVHYGRVAMLLHWYIAALVSFEFISAASFRLFNPGDLGYFHAAYRLHMSAGMSLLALSIYSVVWRLLHKYPRLPDDMSLLARILAKGAHALLYMFIFAASLIGWLVLSARQSAAAFFGSFHWPKITSVSELGYPQRVQINATLMPCHSIVAYAGLCLVGLHVLAALYHHFWRGDRILSRMLPVKVIPESPKRVGSK